MKLAWVELHIELYLKYFKEEKLDKPFKLEAYTNEKVNFFSGLSGLYVNPIPNLTN